MFLVFEGDVFDPIAQGIVDNNVVGETTFYAQVSCDFCLSELIPLKVQIFDCDPPNDACGGCTYFVQLYDSGFDGWDGAQFQISINEGPFEVFKPTAEDGGCLLFPIDIIDGGSIDYAYWEGANAEEHSFKILDAFGNIVASDGMQFTGSNIDAGVTQTVKVDCPACCTDPAEAFTFVFTAGLDAVEKSWEIRDNEGTRIAFANGGEYAGVFSGQTISTTLLLEGVYQVAQGPDNFMDELTTSFTLPCGIDCPVEETILADNLGSCLLNSYAADLIEAPICNPNNCHASIAPVLEVCYPSAIGGLVQGPLGTTSASLPVGTNPVIYKVTYADGQIRRCTSQVHVISEINPILACNDFLIVPLVSDGGNCETVITADMILESPDTASNPSELFLPIPDVGCGPHGEIIQDIDVTVNLVHNDIEDLTIILLTPNGTSITLLERRTCNNNGGQNINVVFDSEANTPVFAACNPGFPGLSGTLRPAQPLSLLYNLPYEDLQGDWTLLVRDDDDTAFEGIGVGEVLSANIELTAGFPFPYDANDCNLASVTLISEVVEETSCDQSDWLGANIVRVWQAVDVFGNATNCTQTVGLRAPMLNEFDLPEDIELECGTVPSDPALVTPELSGESFFECFIVEDSQKDLCGTWEIVNWCANTVLTHDQLITVTDNFGPSIAQSNITVGTNEGECLADVILDDLAISDACSEITDVTATYFIGSSITIVDLGNGDSIDGLELGSNTITVTATDECSNATTQDVIITVVDDVDPTASCNDGLNISLSDTGSGYLSAVEFDEGSNDNCSDVTVLIRSLGCEGGAFAPTAEFSCCDLGMVTVELLVTDAAGNTNTCWADLLVEDAASPTITCQDDVTINCDEGLHAPDLFVAPFVSDNCNTTVSESEFTEAELPNCGQLLSKTYTVTDGSDKTDDASCTQTITVVHTSDFIVQFPADQEFDNCELGVIAGRWMTLAIR